MKRKGIIKTLAVVFAAIFATLFVFSFGACGEESGGEEPDERLTVRIGSDDYSPFFYRNESGDFAGIDVELATEAFKRIGRRAVFIEIDWSEKNLRLENGEIDCLWGCFSMTGREELYAWAGPYMKSRHKYFRGFEGEKRCDAVYVQSGRAFFFRRRRKNSRTIADIVFYQLREYFRRA